VLAVRLFPAFVLVAAVLAACGDSAPLPPFSTTPSTDPASSREPSVLVFHRTAGFAHDSIPAGITALTELGAEHAFAVVATEDPGVFTDTGLARFEVIVFLNTTGDVLDESGQRAMEKFVGGGGGFVGIHAAADTEYDWPWYGGLVGAYFARHPDPQLATVEVVVTDHPVTEGLPARFERVEEWYDFRGVPGPGVTILAVVDEATYEGGGMGNPHPIMWAHEYAGGRSVYTGFGHASEAFAEPLVRRVLVNAIRWAAGWAGDASAGHPFTAGRGGGRPYPAMPARRRPPRAPFSR
jgi:cytochrome c